MPHPKQHSGQKDTRNKKRKAELAARQATQAERLRRIEREDTNLKEDKVVKVSTRKIPMNSRAQRRRDGALHRLTFQLQSGTKIGNQPLTKEDKVRIEGEVATLNKRLKHM